MYLWQKFQQVLYCLCLSRCWHNWPSRKSHLSGMSCRFSAYACLWHRCRSLCNTFSMWPSLSQPSFTLISGVAAQCFCSEHCSWASSSSLSVVCRDILVTGVLLMMLVSSIQVRHPFYMLWVNFVLAGVWVIEGHSSVTNGVIVCSYFFVCSFAITMGPVSWTYPAELVRPLKPYHYLISRLRLLSSLSKCAPRPFLSPRRLIGHSTSLSPGLSLRVWVISRGRHTSSSEHSTLRRSYISSLCTRRPLVVHLKRSKRSSNKDMYSLLGRSRKMLGEEHWRRWWKGRKKSRQVCSIIW